ncbi:putative uncharacterized protein DDB_G0290521 [Helianthus annuus]|uniref:putative uncharacterized protein DDB_G0290521 n=1 Tax=Helianthus annuus TaxID=4232 RepID=UPI000B8FF476|nr:putative uncharacterized protein DDB_G0290521 [Helianthus annuus]
MENLATPEKQPATSQPQQFSPTPTQPSPNTTIPVPPQQPQSTQPTSTSPVPSFSTFFPNFDNNEPTSTQTTSLQHPTTNQTVNLQQSSPYVRIIPDDTPSPIQTQAPNATINITSPKIKITIRGKITSVIKGTTSKVMVR